MIQAQDTAEEVEEERAEKRRQLAASADSGDPVWARYHGGGQPGRVRPIGPLSLVNNRTVRAWCLFTGLLKSYSLDALEIVPEGAEVHLYDPVLAGADTTYQVLRAEVSPSRTTVVAAGLSRTDAKAACRRFNEESRIRHPWFSGWTRPLYLFTSETQQGPLPSERGEG